MISLIFRIVLVLISFPVIIFPKSFSTFVEEHNNSVDGKYHWCGTPLVHEYRSFIERETGSSFAKVSNIKKTMLNYDNLSETYIRSGSRFVIHYAISGNDSVNISDTNFNGVPDYIDEVAAAFDSSYQKEVIDYGFQDPFDVVDTIHIYIGNLAKNIYALAHPNFVMELRNNYNGFLDAYDTMPELAIRVTVAHEFFHFIQFTYYDTDNYSSFPFIYEASAVWMEDEVYPQIDDYLQYIPTFYKNIDKSLLTSYPDVWYSRCLWFKYLKNREGFGLPVIKSMWDNLETDTSLYENIDKILIDYGSNFAEAYGEFAKWCYFVEENAISGKYFKDAANFNVTLVKDIASLESEKYYETEMADLSFKYLTINDLEIDSMYSLLFSRIGGKAFLIEEDSVNCANFKIFDSNYTNLIVVNGGKGSCDFEFNKSSFGDTIFCNSSGVVYFSNDSISFSVTSSSGLADTLLLFEKPLSTAIDLLDKDSLEAVKYFSFSVFGKQSSSISNINIDIDSTMELLSRKKLLEVSNGVGNALPFLVSGSKLIIDSTFTDEFTVVIFRKYEDLKSKPPFPQPFNRNIHTVLKISEIDSNSILVNVYSLSGSLVKSISKATNQVVFSWDLNDSKGKHIAPGIYMYTILDYERKIQKMGKLAIIK